MMKTSRTRLSTACSNAVASSHWMARRCEQSIWGLTTPRLRDHRQGLINRPQFPAPEFPELMRQNFRNPHFEHVGAQHLATRNVVVGAQAEPGAKVLAGGKTGHVGPDLGNDGLRQRLGDPDDVDQ